MSSKEWNSYKIGDLCHITSSKRIFEEPKIDEFRALYRQHENHVCLLVLSELGAQFVFYEKK